MSRSRAGFAHHGLARLTWVTMLLLLWLSAGHAQESVRARIDSLFQSGDYERVELEVLRLGARPDGVSDEDLAWIHATAGFAMIMLERETDARDHFRRALDADPALMLDPVRISPKFRVVFDEVRTEHRARTPDWYGPRYRGPKPLSQTLNLFLPGTGQIREGKILRGGLYLGAQILTAVLWLGSMEDLRDSRAAYLTETDSVRIRLAYDRYNEDLQSAWIYGSLAAGVYLASQIDLAFVRVPRTSEDSRLTLTAEPIAGGARARFRYQW